MGIKAAVIDDSVIYRKIIGDILSEIPGVSVVGTASNGKDALLVAKNKLPDIMTLDVEMPVMDGLAALEAIKQDYPQIQVIMVSSLTKAGARITIEALQKGAADFIAKPEGRDSLDSKTKIQGFLTQIIQSLVTDKKTVTAAIPAKPKAVAESAAKPSVIAIGISTGGPQALGTLLAKMPAFIPVPVLIVQHMPAIFTKALAESLSKKTGKDVVEAEHGMIIHPGKYYIAPGGKQMKVEMSPSGWNELVITDDPPENHCKPSADYLFRSVSKVYGSNALGVIMTGMGNDGTLGLRLMKRAGAHIIAQDQETSTVFGMPREAINAGVVDAVLPLDEIAGHLAKLLGSR